MEKFEDYIRRNRDAFDDREPAEGHEKRFEALLGRQFDAGKPHKRARLVAVLSVAALLSILIAVAIKFIPGGEIIPANHNGECANDNELVLTNDYYKQLMDAQIADIMCKLSNTDTGNQVQLAHDLKQLMDNNQSFVEEVEGIDNKEIAMYYLVKHYKTNIRILEGINEKLGKHTNC